MVEKVAIPAEDEQKRKAKMTSRLCVLFVILDFAVFGVIVYQLLQLF